MNYELAKELKDAGFRFLEMHEPTHLADNPSCLYCGSPCIEIDNKMFMRPTLSELIAACGHIFVYEDENTEREQFLVIWWGKDKWCAGYASYGDDIYIDDYPSPKEEGKTPEEAVAKLWLALNKNNKNE